MDRTGGQWAAANAGTRQAIGGRKFSSSRSTRGNDDKACTGADVGRALDGRKLNCTSDTWWQPQCAQQPCFAAGNWSPSWSDAAPSCDGVYVAPSACDAAGSSFAHAPDTRPPSRNATSNTDASQRMLRKLCRRLLGVESFTGRRV